MAALSTIFTSDAKPESPDYDPGLRHTGSSQTHCRPYRVTGHHHIRHFPHQAFLGGLQRYVFDGINKRGIGNRMASEEALPTQEASTQAIQQ